MVRFPKKMFSFSAPGRILGSGHWTCWVDSLYLEDQRGSGRVINLLTKSP